MALVNRDRLLARLRCGTLLDPSLIAPFRFFRQAVQHGGRCGRMFRPERDGVGFERQGASGMVTHLVFVSLARRQFGNEKLPDAGLVAQTHRMAPAVPDIEVTDEADIVRVRRPDDEPRPGHVAVFNYVGAEDVVEARAPDVLDGGKILGREHRAERIWVPVDPGLLRPSDFEFVVRPVHRSDTAAEEAGRIDQLQFAEDFPPSTASARADAAPGSMARIS